MRLKQLMIIFAFILSVFQTCRADDCCSWGIEVGGEFLWMRPSVCNTIYAIVDPREYVPIGNIQGQTDTDEAGPIGDVKEASQRYEPGFRVQAGLLVNCNCNDITGRYARIHGRHTDTIFPCPKAGGIWATQMHSGNVTFNVALLDPMNPRPPFLQIVLFNPIPDLEIPNQVNACARSRTSFYYDAADLEWAMRNCLGRNGWIRAFAGVHFAYVRHHQDIHYQGTIHPGNQPIIAASNPLFLTLTMDGNVSKRSETWALGPQIGFEGTYSILCGLGIGARASVGLLAGETEAKYSQSYVTREGANGEILCDRITDLKTDRRGTFVPTADLRVGLNYTCCCGNCLTLSGEVGYEFVTYRDALRQGPEFREDRGLQAMDCTAFSLDGLYVRLLGEF